MHILFLSLLAAIPLAPIDHPVGFKSFWMTDPARTYRTAFDAGKTYGATKSPRPVLVNVWYPAQAGGKPMEHGSYLDIAPDDPQLKPLAAALVEYQHKVIAQELTGAEPAKATEAQKQAVARAMKRSTGCVRGAVAAAGKFPLVIYHSGAGSSFEDNALLCEELARDGYVVMGSAFQAADGKSFNVDVENAGREFEFLLRLAAGMENVDIRHVALIGHSAGAHGSLIYAARAGISIDAIVSLDTTQDYVTLSDSRWPLLVNALTNGRETYTTPTMFVAGPPAFFELADTMAHSERVYLTIPVLTHNEYIFQGETTAALAAELASTNKEEKSKRAESVASQGKELRKCVRLYLASKLKQNTTAFGELMQLQRTRVGDGPSIELMPAGSTAPVTGSQEATPRSLFQALKTGGAEAAIRELQKPEAKNKSLREPYLVFQLQYFLAANGKPDQARQLFEYYLSIGVDTRSILVSQADFFASMKRHPVFVEGCVQLGRAIAGNNSSVAEMVKKYGKKAEGP